MDHSMSVALKCMLTTLGFFWENQGNAPITKFDFLGAYLIYLFTIQSRVSSTWKKISNCPGWKCQTGKTVGPRNL